MSDKREVITNLFEEVSRKFDTRKVLNRATDYSFDESFMQQLQQDGLTLEMLNEIEGKVPIFKYQTQITIHGRFPDTQINRIFGYKNCIRNQNETLGLRYNALDVRKKKELQKRLQLLVKRKHPMVPHLKRDSTGMAFQYASTKLEPVKELYDRIDTSLFYGKKAAWKSWHPFYGVMYVCNINVGVFAEENGWKILENWTGVTQERWEEMRVEDEAAQAAWEKENKEKNDERNRKSQENYDTIVAELVGKYPEYSGGDLEGSILITGLQNPEYTGYQCLKFEKGSFGRVKLSRSNKKEFQLPEVIVWDRSKTVTKSDLVTIIGKKRWFVLSAAEVQKRPEKPVKQPQVTGERIEVLPGEIVMVRYSDRSFALFGNTKPLKDKLGRQGLGGAFNNFLTNPITQQKEPGWIFSNSKEEAVKSSLNIDYATV